MATFQYRAHRSDQTPVDGQIDADDLKSARRLLEDQGLLVAAIHQVKDAQAKMVTPSAAPTSEQPSEAERLALQRQLNRVLATGKTLAPALLAYAEELPPGSRRLRLQRIANQLEQGQGLTPELAAGQIDEEWIPLLISGASSGDLSQIPNGIIDEVQREGHLRGEFALAFAYPLLMIATTAAILLLITLWITPPFHRLFADFALELPVATVVVITFAETMSDSWWVILIAGLLLAAILFYSSGFRDWMIQRTPFLGATVRLSNRARFTRYLADLMEAEVPLADALRISGRNVGQTELRREANQWATELDSGNTDLGHSPSFGRSLLRTVVHALQLQSNPRAAARIVRELSWMYDQQTRNRLAWTSSLVEPAFIVLLGSAVGFYVVALFMPLMQLIQAISG